MNDQSSDGEIETETEEHEVERMDAILGEDEKKEKLVYIFVVLRRNYELRVKAFNPHQRQVEEDEDDTGGRFVDVTSKFKKEMPPDLKKIKFFGLASLGPTIYFIGGRKEKKKKKNWLESLYDWEATSNKVFAFDTESEQWLDTVACMKLPRRSSAIVTYDNKIYAFGGTSNYFPHSVPPPPALWAEFYDPKTDTWDYLGGGYPPEELRDTPQIPTPVVLQEQEICLICLQEEAVYIYSFKCKRWLQCVSDPAFNLDGCSWNSSVVALNNTVFWECYGSILTTDYPPRQHPVLKHTLPEAPRFFGPDAWSHTESYLVDAGNGKLCLVYDFWVHNKHRENFVCFHTFELGGRSHGDDAQFLVHHKHHQIYPCPHRSYAYSLMAIAVAATRCTAAQAQLYPRGHGQNVAGRQTNDARIGVPTCCSEPTQVGFGRSKKKLQGTKLNWKTLG